jgi:hypothetical protein
MLQIQSLEGRIEKLERQNRRLRRFGVLAAFALAGVVLVGAAGRQENELKVNSLVITAADGTPAILLHAPKGGGEILLYDVNAKRHFPQISITCTPGANGGTQIFMNGSKGQRAVNIVAQERGKVITW